MFDINKAIDIINNRRNLAEIKNSNILAELRKDSVFAELENRIGGLSFEIARLETFNANCESLKEQLKELYEAMGTRLSELKFTPEDLIIKYNCPVCKDTGFIKGERCNCLKNIIYENIRNDCGKLITDISDFEKINTSVYGNDKKGYINTFKQLEKYASSFPNTIPYLILYGNTGVGKSYIASVLCNKLMKKGHTALFINACRLNQLFLNYHLASIEKKEEIFQPITDCDLLIIDDLGSEILYNNVTVAYLYLTIIQRFSKNTVITTNLNPNELEARYDKRIASRLTDVNYSRYVEIKGSDLRLIKSN